MRTCTLALIGLVALLSGCSDHQASKSQAGVALAVAPARNVAGVAAPVRSEPFRIASYPDHGGMIAYDRSKAVLHRGASVWHPVRLSEEHAIRAIAAGGMVIDAPNGQPIRLQYGRHIEHSDGNWTWIGHTSDGREAVMTFGEKAVYGSIPNGSGEPLQLATSGGRNWLIETDDRMVASNTQQKSPDFVVAPNRTQATPQGLMANPSSDNVVATTKRMVAASPPAKEAAAAATASTTVDVVLGYTTGYATRLGGPSQAATRLTYLVDMTNQAYIDSKVDAAIRLVHTVEVAYPDATANETALQELTGVSCVDANDGSLRMPDHGSNCVAAQVPTALQPLVAAREQYGADLVSLVRKYEDPENGSCGVAWLLGAGQTPIDSASAPYGFSIVSDTSGNQYPDNGNTCREEYLAHELGHNMGLQHDRATAQGVDDTNSDGKLLDPEEYGRYPYSFGYSTGTAAGNFYTVMSLRRTGQAGYRVFSNPRISICGGFACGVVDLVDNVRALSQTMPIVAGFRAAVVPSGAKWLRGDFNGDGRSDILWRNNTSGVNTIWLSANAATQQPVTSVSNMAWDVVGIGDFGGDGKSDILWRNSVTGVNVIWTSANASTSQSVTSVSNLAWEVAGVADFDHDGQSDILWRNSVTGANVIWRSANSATQMWMSTVDNLQWAIVGVGDFNGDGNADVLWRNSVSGGNVIWNSANSATRQWVSTLQVPWSVAAVADYDGDGKADVLWRNGVTGGNAIWKSANSATVQWASTVSRLEWTVIGAGDFDRDGKADVLWRNLATGANTIWKSANAATQQPVSSVTNLSWIIAG